MQKYSERLGLISNVQLQKALDTFDLGKLIKAEPISQGLFGQNVFITSSKGEFVLRGKPHYDWQFKNEKYFVDLLHEKTKTPVPYPYLLDTETNIFGWEYVIMPRMKGKNLSDNLDEDCFTDNDRIEIAIAQGKLLTELQKLTYPYCGKYDLQLNTIKAYMPDWITEYKKQILEKLEKSTQYNKNTSNEDILWVKSLIEKADDAIEEFTPTFYMQDFKPGNMIVDKIYGKWQITGLFDFMESSFGHPEADISRMYAVYVEHDRNDLASTFLNSYMHDNEDMDKFLIRFKLFMLHDKSIIWEWVQRNNRVWWNKDWSFREWVSKYMEFNIL